MQELDEEDAITGINVTPLVDITLVLLIIFMVTARFISEPSIGINLPKTSQQSTPPAADNNVFLTITSNHDIFLGNKKVTQSDLGNAAKSMLQEKPNLTVIVRADKSVTHGEVVTVLDELRGVGITQFGIAVEANN